MTIEQQFTHKAFLTHFEQLNPKEAKELLEIIYANYLIRGKLLENIIKYCVAYDIPLPSFGDLIEL